MKNEAKPEILLPKTIYGPTLAALERDYTVRKLWTAADAGAFLKETCAGVRGVVTSGAGGFSRSMFEALPKLEIVACFGNPRSSMDFAAAKERGVIVTNTPDDIVESVADLALGLLINVMRRIGESDRFVRAGKWPAGLPRPGNEVRGKLCGIVGFGRIGRAIAKRVEACCMSVCYHGPNRKEDTAYPYYPDLENMARAVDCLVVACPALPSTRNLIDARILNALGPDGFLVNISRGANVDEAALIDALVNRRIAGAGLDVFQKEPHAPKELLGMENVVLVPHIGSHTFEVREERGRKVLANLRAHFAGQPVPNPVTSAPAERGV